MNFSILSSGPGGLCAFLILLVNNIGSSYAANPALFARGGSKGDTEMPDAPDIYDGGQSPTSDRKTGIGDASDSQAFNWKGKVVNDIQDDNYKFTVDAMQRKGAADLEIILDGKSITPGTNDLWKSLRKAMDRLKEWDPSSDSSNKKVEIEKSPFDDWEIVYPTQKGRIDKGDIQWEPQLTAPMPLEGIQWLIEHQEQKKEFPMYRFKSNTVRVLPDFFKKSPGGVSKDDVEERPDVLGFMSLILAYAKAAHKASRKDSPKVLQTVMPRTDLTTIYNTQGISKVIPKENLYEIVKALACFKNTDASTGGKKYQKDDDYCTGSFDDPKPNKKMDEQKFRLDEGGDELTVESWIKSISDGTVPDALTSFDKKHHSGSLGGFGTSLENVLDTDRAVPIFEFRGLDWVDTTAQAVDVAKKCEENVVELHEKFEEAP